MASELLWIPLLLRLWLHQGPGLPDAGLAVSSYMTVISPASVTRAAAVHSGMAGQVGPRGRLCISPLLSGGLTPAGGISQATGAALQRASCGQEGRIPAMFIHRQRSLAGSWEAETIPPSHPLPPAWGRLPLATVLLSLLAFRVPGDLVSCVWP